MFTENVINAAIEAGIFDKYNNVTATNPAQILRFFEKLTAEKTKNIRHKTAEIALNVGHDLTPDQAHRLIINIQD